MMTKGDTEGHFFLSHLHSNKELLAITATAMCFDKNINSPYPVREARSAYYVCCLYASALQTHFTRKEAI